MTDTSVEAMVERLRSSAKAFRENDIYTQDGDPVRLTVQAAELDDAADLLASQAQTIAALRSAATSALAVIDTDEYPRIVKSLIAALQSRHNPDPRLGHSTEEV